MRLIYYLFFIIYFFTFTNSVNSKHADIKIKHKNGVKVYVVHGKTFHNFRRALKYSRKIGKHLKERKTTKKPIKKLTKLPGRRKTRRPLLRTTRKPLLGKTTPKRGPLITPPRQTKVPTTKHNSIAMLKNHYYQEINKYRVLHQVKPLEIDHEIEKAAQKHAEKMAMAGKETPGADTTYGENIISSSLPLERGVEQWYNTIKRFDFNKKERNNENVEFINLVWKSTTHMGCGIAKNKKSSKSFVSCKFYPKADTFNSDDIKKNVFDKKHSIFG